MFWLTLLFVCALVGGTLTRWWLAGRQIRTVQAHRDHVPPLFERQTTLEDQRRAADYTAARARLDRIAALAGAAIVLLLTLGGGIAAVDALWRPTAWGQPWLGAAVVFTVLSLLMLARLPFAIWRTFKLEAHFGFNRVSPALFVADMAKQLSLTLIVGGPLLLALLTLMERAGRWWWLPAWAGWLLVTLTLTWAWPRFIAPLFNRFTPLTDEALSARVAALLRRCGFISDGLFVVDGSRRSAHGNAYFTGLGRSKRIALFDTLLDRLGAPEVEAVLAHELGHFRLHHVRQRLFVSALTALGAFALFAWLAAQADFYAALGVPIPSAHSAALLFMLIGPVFSFFATPLLAWWSRRNEFAADDFAVRHADVAALASALVKLYRGNATTLTPDPVYSAFYDSHPSAQIRIARLNPHAS